MLPGSKEEREEGVHLGYSVGCMDEVVCDLEDVCLHLSEDGSLDVDDL